MDYSRYITTTVNDGYRPQTWMNNEDAVRLHNLYEFVLKNLDDTPTGWTVVWWSGRIVVAVRRYQIDAYEGLKVTFRPMTDWLADRAKN